MLLWIIFIYMTISVNIATATTGCQSESQLSKSNVTADMSKAVTLDNVNNDLHYAKLNSDRAFCANIQRGFFIEVSFGGLRLISKLQIQGFKLNGQVRKLDAFLLEFSFDRVTWYMYNNKNDAPMYFLVEVRNSLQVVNSKLPLPGVGRYMRIYPRWRPQDRLNQVVCVRFDIYGCSNVDIPTMAVPKSVETKVKKTTSISCNATGLVGLVVKWRNGKKVTDMRQSNVIELRQTVETKLKVKATFQELSSFVCTAYQLFVRCVRNYTCHSHYAFDPSLEKESVTKVEVNIVFPGRVANLAVENKTQNGVWISWKRVPLNDLPASMVNYLLACNITGSMKSELLPVTMTSKFLLTSRMYHPYRCRLEVVRNNLSTIFPYSFNQPAAVLNFRSRSIRPNVEPTITIKADPESHSVRVDVKPNFYSKEFGVAKGYRWNATMMLYGRRRPKESSVRDLSKQSIFADAQGSHNKSFQIRNLKPWSTYLIQVSIYNDDGLFSNKSTVEIETDEGKPTGAPSLEKELIRSHSVRLKIKKTANFSEEYHNGVLTAYCLLIEPDNITRDITRTRSYGLFEVPDLKPNKEYIFKAKVGTKAGYGPYGEPLVVRTQSGKPGQPILTMMHRSDTSNKLVIIWQFKPRHSAQKYEIQVTMKNRRVKPYYVDANTMKGGVMKYKFDLDIDSVEQVEMRAYTDTGWGEWSDPLEVNRREEDDPLKIQSTLIIGFSVAFGLFIAFVVICFIYFRRHYRAQPRHMKDSHQDTMLLNRELQVFDEELDSEPSSANPRSRRSSDTSTSNLISSSTHDPIPVEEFTGYMSIVKQNNYGILFDDFKNHMPVGKCYAWHVAEREENISKNRYTNICAYDHSRIVLKHNDDGEEELSDYINANGICGYQKWENGNYKYISTQGPMEETAADFWHMVWQENSSIIVMLTNLKDNHKVKCAQYWPNKNAKLYGKIEVTLDKIDKTADYITRTFQLVQTESKEQRTVRQFHFIPWPDHGVPDYPTSLLSLRRRVRHYYEDGKPMVIHCSAGVGRSGCFILIDAMLERIDKEKSVDIFNYLNYMRRRRIFMVQIVEQYIFAHTAILEYITFGNTETFVGELDKKFKELVRGNGMAEEYSLLERNKVADINASNTYKVLLREGMFVDAYHVDGFKMRDAFILTKAPSEETVVYFWKMVLEKHCHTIVMLNKCQEVSQEYFKYWPHVDGHNAYQDMAVMLNSEVANGNIITRKIKVTTDKRRCEVNHFQFVDWPDTDIPDQRVYNNICTLMQAVEKSQHNLGNGPIIVHSGNDYGRSGTFIAIYNSTERLKVEQLIDVLQCVRAIRNSQPLAVDNVSQYQFIYNMLRTYLEGFENYWNYKDYNNCRSPFGSTSLN